MYPKALPLNKLYLILGLGFPSAAHFNVTSSPSSAVLLAGGIMITGEVTGAELSKEKRDLKVKSLLRDFSLPITNEYCM